MSGYIVLDDPERRGPTNAVQRRAMRRHAKRWHAQVKWSEHRDGTRVGEFPGGCIVSTPMRPDSLASYLSPKPA